MKYAIFAAAILLLCPLAEGASAAGVSGTIKSVNRAKDSFTLVGGTVFHLPEGIEVETLKPGEKISVTFTTSKKGIHNVSAVRAIR
ncbi:DUF1344 domain-containing protein [Rhizobium tubonense]|uniref:DUF1344 domain-containing protein n=1 Tax=Rhizobium tubonense TaxID=484088 RepID=A0A2W4EN05_9HYPH|nr:DUF1344 domain-containing protein [Rhizobium tubonense]PZM15046.1 hypothetical protein CPY51_08345 [Rhizobium tubonense]